MKAQESTTKRTGITIPQQYRWHKVYNDIAFLVVENDSERMTTRLFTVDRRCFRGASDQKHWVLSKDSAGVWGVDASFYPWWGRNLLSCVRWYGPHCGRFEQEETREEECRLSGLDNCLPCWGCEWRDGSYGVSATGYESSHLPFHYNSSSILLHIFLCF